MPKEAKYTAAWTEDGLEVGSPEEWQARADELHSRYKRERFETGCHYDSFAAYSIPKDDYLKELQMKFDYLADQIEDVEKTLEDTVFMKLFYRPDKLMIPEKNKIDMSEFKSTGMEQLGPGTIIEGNKVVYRPKILVDRDYRVMEEMDIPEQIIQNFYKRIHVIKKYQDKNGCLRWHSYMDVDTQAKSDYGQLTWNVVEKGVRRSRTIPAHRLSYALAIGRGLQPEEFILHSRMPGGHPGDCVNPTHLRIGDAKENAEDRVADQQAGMLDTDREIIIGIYKDAWDSRLNNQQVANKYDVKPHKVSRIKLGESYGWLTGHKAGQKFINPKLFDRDAHYTEHTRPGPKIAFRAGGPAVICDSRLICYN